MLYLSYRYFKKFDGVFHKAPSAINEKEPFIDAANLKFDASEWFNDFTKVVTKSVWFQTLLGDEEWNAHLSSYL